MNFSLNDSYNEYKLSIGDADFVFFSTFNMFAETQSEISPIHTHDYCELFYVIRGKIRIQTETETKEFSGGTCVFIPETLPHTSEICEDSQRLVISFFMKKNKKKTESNFFDSFSNLFKNEIIFLPDFIGTDAFKRLSACYYSDFADKDELIISYLREILLLIKASLSNEEPVRVLPIFDDSSYRNYVIGNYFSAPFPKKSLTDLSILLHLSPQQTQRMIKKRYGEPFRERMISAKMNYAKTLLKTTDFSASKIASSLGYDCTHSFFDAFKKFYGMTPMEFKKGCSKMRISHKAKEMSCQSHLITYEKSVKGKF